MLKYRAYQLSSLPKSPRRAAVGFVTCCLRPTSWALDHFGRVDRNTRQETGRSYGQPPISTSDTGRCNVVNESANDQAARSAITEDMESLRRHCILGVAIMSSGCTSMSGDIQSSSCKTALNIILVTWSVEKVSTCAAEQTGSYSPQYVVVRVPQLGHQRTGTTNLCTSCPSGYVACRVTYQAVSIESKAGEMLITE